MDQDKEQQPLNQQETEAKPQKTLEQKLADLKRTQDEQIKAEQAKAAVEAEQAKATVAENLRQEKTQLEESVKKFDDLKLELKSVREEVGNAEKKLQDMIDANSEVLSAIGDIKAPEDLLQYPELSDSPEVHDWQQKKELLNEKNSELATLTKAGDQETAQSRLDEINQELAKHEQEEQAKAEGAKKEQVEKMAEQINSIYDVEQLLKTGEDEELVRLGWMEKPGTPQVKELQFNDVLLKVFEEQNNKSIEAFQEQLVDKNTAESLAKTLSEIKTAQDINLESPAIGNSLITIEGNDQIKVFAELPQLYQEMKAKEKAIEDLERKIATRENEHAKKTIKILDRSYEQDMANLKQEVEKINADRKAIIDDYNQRTASKNKLEQYFNQDLYQNARTWIIEARKAKPGITVNEILVGLEDKSKADAEFNPSQEERDEFQKKFDKRQELRKKAGKTS